jgi:molybdopterin converting factor small subunit
LSRRKEEVRVQIKYLASVRERTGRRLEEARFARGSTLTDVAAWLAARYGLRLPDPNLIATLNGKGWNQLPDKLDGRIRNGDVICLFPVVSGG